MVQSRTRAYRLWLVVALVVSATFAGIGVSPSLADVSAVRGSAYGLSLNASLFGTPQPAVGPTPTVTLPPGGANPALTANAPTGVASAGPARFFTSGPLDVSTQGTTGPGGSVTSSATANNITNLSGEVLTATSVAATCTASETGITSTTTVTGGVLQTDSGSTSDPPVPDHPAVTVPVPVNPAANASFDGHIHVNGATDSFRYVFNERITNPDGSLTVNAAHLYLLGPTAVGDLIIGQVVCGITATAPTTTTTTTAPTTTPGATTTTPPPTTTATTTPPTTTATTAPPTTTAPATTTTVPSGVGGGAYGYFVSVSLFGGAPGTRGPAPTVTLPADGSASPVTATAPTADAQFGPAIIFTSDRLDVSTQGTPGGSVTSSADVANLNRSGQEQLTAAAVRSTCTASGTGETGSVTITNGRLVVSSGTDFDSDADDTVVQLPADPAPNTAYSGKLEQVGDTFRVVVNEQVRSAGSITVNAVHLFLEGPTAVGELIVGQSRCATTAAGSSGGGGAGGGGQSGSGSGARLSSTGNEAPRLIAMALVLLMGGWWASFWTAGVRLRARNAGPPWPRRGPPWAGRSFLR